MVVINTLRLVLFLAGFYSVFKVSTAKAEVSHHGILLNGFMLLIAGFLAAPDSWPSSFYFPDHLPRVITVFVINSIIWGALFWVAFFSQLFFLAQNKKTASKRKAFKEQQNSDAAKILALEELESGNLDKLTWADALIAAGGDEVKARGEYLKLRKIKSTSDSSQSEARNFDDMDAKEIQDETRNNPPKTSPQVAGNEPDVTMLFVIIAIISLVILAWIKKNS